MARIETKSEWRTGAALDEARGAVLEFFRSRNFKAVSLGGEELTARQGSGILTRLSDVWSVNTKNLPKEMRVRVSDDAGSSRIRVVVRDLLGHGSLGATLKTKFERAFGDEIRALRTVLPE